jgi:hypothetical protein
MKANEMTILVTLGRYREVPGMCRHLPGIQVDLNSRIWSKRKIYAFRKDLQTTFSDSLASDSSL